MSEDTNEQLLDELRAKPSTRGPVSDALIVARLVAELAEILARALPSESKLGEGLRKLLDTRTELLGALAERGGGSATPD